MSDFLLDEHELKKCEKLFQNIGFFLHVVLSKHCKYRCFWLVCFENWKWKHEENRGICGTFKTPCWKTSQNTVFSTRSLKNTVNSDVFGRFSSLTLPKRGVFSFTSTKIVQTTVSLDVFNLKYLTRNHNNNNNNNNNKKNNIWHLVSLVRGGPCRGAAWIWSMILAHTIPIWLLPQRQRDVTLLSQCDTRASVSFNQSNPSFITTEVSGRSRRSPFGQMPLIWEGDRGPFNAFQNRIPVEAWSFAALAFLLPIFTTKFKGTPSQMCSQVSTLLLATVRSLQMGCYNHMKFSNDETPKQIWQRHLCVPTNQDKTKINWNYTSLYIDYNYS